MMVLQFGHARKTGQPFTPAIDFVPQERSSSTFPAVSKHQSVELTSAVVEPETYSETSKGQELYYREPLPGQDYKCVLKDSLLLTNKAGKAYEKEMLTIRTRSLRLSSFWQSEK